MTPNGVTGNSPKAQYYTTLPVYTLPPIVTTTGVSCNNNGNSCTKNVIAGVPSADIAKISIGQMITSTNNTNVPALTYVTGFDAAAGTITISNNATHDGSVGLTIKWETSPLPLDKQRTGICTGTTCLQGNGDWDCADYWALNHPTRAVPSGCTSSNPTLSRYQVYRYEITNNFINDWSGNGLANNVNNAPGNGENGAPYCAASNGVSGVDTTTGGLDRGYSSTIVNCRPKMSGALKRTAPTAAFAKFMTRP